MLASYKWLCALTGFSPDPAELADRLTFGGLEVDALRRVGGDQSGIVVGVIEQRERHPVRENLSVVRVDGGDGAVQVVCGAPNCPGPGARVVLARVGARVGGIAIAERELSGVTSVGMLCSEVELGLGPDAGGILLLDGETAAPAGTPIAAALDLDDWILDIGVTPNRPDALSHRGLARDVCALYGRPFAPPAPEPVPASGAAASELARVELRDPAGCPRYAAAVINGVTVKQSPFGLRYRLHNLGVRPISNLVDATNLVLLEWGQPLHAFDLDQLADRTIVVRKAREGERMTTLDEVERVLLPEDLLICDAKRPVAVAGVMGGLDTGITDATRNLLIECAYFEPRGIRRTSKRLKLSSESSYRFERGVEPTGVPEVLSATTALVCRLAGGAPAPGFIDCQPAPIAGPILDLRLERYARVMGVPVASAEARRILEALGARVEGAGPVLRVHVPTSRPDIEREVDLIEELARIRGLDEVPAALPRIQCQLPDRQEFEAIRRAKEILAAAGLDEAINYSFVPEALLALLGRGQALVRIANPLSAERSAMRTTLLAGLLEGARRAATRFLPGARQFEVARTFHDEGRELPREVVRVAALLTGPRDAWVGEAEAPLDFYDAKGLVERFVLELTSRSPELVSLETPDPAWHPRRTVEVRLDGVAVGLAGELHPSVLAGLKLLRGAVGFELELLPLWERCRRPRAPALPEFPPMSRDVALLVDESQDAEPLCAALHAACGALAESVRLFDVYRGEKLPEGRKSLAFSVIYRAADRTLTDDEVDRVHRAAVERVAADFGAKAR
ncbi:MAG TPA: phenylalanine--tRNA ligase subunit beta [Polyangia bacterium]|nr:phenylalanine--tRNA ligase subunit beta [Polyangia bacterium]